MRSGGAASHSAATLIGVAVGGALTLVAANFWPRSLPAPILVGASELRFGTDEHGRAALCDGDGIARVPTGGNGGVHELTIVTDFKVVERPNPPTATPAGDPQTDASMIQNDLVRLIREPPQLVPVRCRTQ